MMQIKLSMKQKDTHSENRLVVAMRKMVRGDGLGVWG